MPTEKWPGQDGYEAYGRACEATESARRAQDSVGAAGAAAASKALEGKFFDLVPQVYEPIECDFEQAKAHAEFVGSGWMWGEGERPDQAELLRLS
jgi:hypothetical protein